MYDLKQRAWSPWCAPVRAFSHRAIGLRGFSSETTDKPVVRGFGTAGMGVSGVCEWVVNCLAVSLNSPGTSHRSWGVRGLSQVGTWTLEQELPTGWSSLCWCLCCHRMNRGRTKRGGGCREQSGCCGGSERQKGHQLND